jgi:hypothetical protein
MRITIEYNINRNVLIFWRIGVEEFGRISKSRTHSISLGESQPE